MTPKHRVRKILLLIFAILLVGGLLVGALFTTDMFDGDTENFIPAETIYTILVVALVLVVLMFVLVITQAGQRVIVRPRNDENVIDETNAPVVQQVVQQQPTVIKVETETTLKKEDKNEQTDESRFFMLTQIDEKYKDYKAPNYVNKIGLEELCNQFRNFMSYKLKLYYNISDIRRFIASLSVSKTMILQGMSGTGKTSLAYAFGEFLQNPTTVVPIQPMWKERTDLIGYYNEFTKKFNEGVLLQKIYEANYTDEIYITVLDEMNIARIEYYFAEFLSLLELPNLESRNLDVITDVWDNDPKLLNNGQLRLAKNMWFIGTANNDDSTFAISDKVYDRAMIINLDTKAEPFEAPKTAPVKISCEHLERIMETAKRDYTISRRNLNRIKKLDSYMIANFHLTFGNRIMKQIKTYVPVFVACGGDELEAIDDILSRKVMRKLEAQNPVYVRNASEGLCNYLDEVFGVDKMPLCKEYILRIARNA